MANRLPTVLNIGSGVYRDTAKRVYIQLAKSENNVHTGVSIDGNSNTDIMNYKIIRFSINAGTKLLREVPIFEGSMKMRFAVGNPNSNTEIICDQSPITNGENDIAFSVEDIKDTICEIIDTFAKDNLLI